MANGKKTVVLSQPRVSEDLLNKITTLQQKYNYKYDTGLIEMLLQLGVDVAERMPDLITRKTVALSQPRVSEELRNRITALKQAYNYKSEIGLIEVLLQLGVDVTEGIPSIVPSKIDTSKLVNES